MKLKNALVVTTLVGALMPGLAAADIDIDVSVKFILSPGGQRTSGNISTDQDVLNEIAISNSALGYSWRAYRIRLIEIIDLPGVSGFYNSCDVEALDDAAKASPTQFAYRDDAINVYITNNMSCGGICSFPGSGDDVMLVTAVSPAGVLMHEIGHYFDLCHTQGCPCEGCADCAVPRSDGIDDTLEDRQCWDRDDIARNAFGMDYSGLSAELQDLVDDVWFNVMSYHLNQPYRLTQLQMDRLSDVANGPRNNVVSGETAFVDGSNTGIQIGSSVAPWSEFLLGWSSVGPEDVLIVRPGTYDEVVGSDLVLTERGLILAPEASCVIR